jgi:hypothetical protein
MSKRIVTIILLIVFSFLTLSCTSLKVRDISKWSPEKRLRVKIFRVYTKAGQLYEFGDFDPAKIKRNEAGDLVIVGNAVDKDGVKDWVEIPLSSAEKTWVERPDLTVPLLAIPTAVIVFFLSLALGDPF